MKVEWWYNDAAYHASDGCEIPLARLIVRDDDTAQVLTDGGERLEMETEAAASVWLVDEEYRRLDSLLEDLKDEGRPVDPRIKPPSAASDDELARKMVIVLGPANGSPWPGKPDAVPGPAGRPHPSQNTTASD